jgi:hypothetical protein
VPGSTCEVVGNACCCQTRHLALHTRTTQALPGRSRSQPVAANVPGPYVLYGARFGGLLVLSYAAHWPNPTEIAGVVFSEAFDPCPSACSYDFPPEHAELDGLAGVHLGARPVVVLTSAGGNGPALAQRSTNACGSALPGSAPTFPPRRHNSRSNHCVSSWPPPGPERTCRPATKHRCRTPAGGANRSADLSPPPLPLACPKSEAAN